MRASWGVAEAQELGIYDIMKSTGAREIELEERIAGLSWEDNKPANRHLSSTTIPGTPKLAFYHPEMQEAVLNAASNSGATVCRGVRVRGLQSNGSPTITVAVDGEEKECTARIIVGADGR